MARCTNCDRDLPGIETLCRDCYSQEYWEVNAPKGNFLQRLGRNGDQWVLGICACLIAAPLVYALLRAPRLMQGITFLYEILLMSIAWVLAPWLLIKEWKEERRLGTLFVAGTLTVQIVCAAFWWIKGTAIWLQINTAVAIAVVVYGYAMRIFGFLKDF
jgi:hypothetical protein